MIKSEVNNLKSKESYWDHVYKNNDLINSGWYQPIPESSLELIENSKISKKAKIIDVGGGDSLLVDHLLRLGYENVTVLDISGQAIEKAKKRLGQSAEKVNWICSDIKNFETKVKFDLWHDRACLHFLTDEDELKIYRQKALQSISMRGALIVGAFSKTGPLKCSGLPIHQFDKTELEKLFAVEFESVENFDSVHITPSNVGQNYVFCRFIRK